MRVVVIYGQSHKGSTYHVAHQLAVKIGGDLREFFLPRDFKELCVGCTACFVSGGRRCPHRARLEPITEALDAADVIILASPVYVFHVTGAMKALLDHYGYRWMVHSPEPSMFGKQAVAVTTAAGAGMRSTLKDMADSLFFWGVARTYRLGVAVAATAWSGVSESKRGDIDRATTRLARRIASHEGRVRPGLRTRAVFFALHLAQRRGVNPADATYWQERGWTGKARPWK